MVFTTYSLDNSSPSAPVQTGYTTIKMCERWLHLRLSNDEVRTALRDSTSVHVADSNAVRILVNCAPTQSTCSERISPPLRRRPGALRPSPYPATATRTRRIPRAVQLRVAAAGMPATPELLTNRAPLTSPGSCHDQVVVWNSSAPIASGARSIRFEIEGYADATESGKRVFLMG
jgi:hypothetical protein